MDAVKIRLIIKFEIDSDIKFFNVTSSSRNGISITREPLTIVVIQRKSRDSMMFLSIFLSLVCILNFQY